MSKKHYYYQVKAAYVKLQKFSHIKSFEWNSNYKSINQWNFSI